MIAPITPKGMALITISGWAQLRKAIASRA